MVDTALDNKDYGVAKIASMMNMTERTFRRRLKEVTDQSPKIFISAIQMERCAKLLLENPTKSIGEIAYLCGFEEASCFRMRSKGSTDVRRPPIGSRINSCRNILTFKSLRS